MNDIKQTLYLVFSSPHSPTAKLSLSVVGKNDTVLFLGDGVFHASTITEPEFHCFFLENDIQVRGLEVPTDRCIGYDAFVGLCEEFDNVISWPK
ncbi:MAG: hypothetical protein CL926_12930 [Deltaproteobacteria bacterium]|jgi:sulfur relay protein TusB/DsrH|nr:hypothetical protein [Deltaproteobacteria bacterium]|tara:strand:+ start:987 stop:1268 length:282 start_codon:yes stop_codon:yes gene_type:complete